MPGRTGEGCKAVTRALEDSGERCQSARWMTFHDAELALDTRAFADVRSTKPLARHDMSAPPSTDTSMGRPAHSSEAFHERFFEGARGATVGRPRTITTADQSITARVSALTSCVATCSVHEPAAAALMGWVGDVEPPDRPLLLRAEGYDEVNQATHAYKEEVKVGYNLQRKIVLLAIWVLTPLALHLEPTLSGFGEAHEPGGFARNLATCARARRWRSAVCHHSAVLRARSADRSRVADQDPHGPVSRIKLYHRAPLQVLRGSLSIRCSARGGEPVVASAPACVARSRRRARASLAA